MANISLSQVRDLWKRVSDWISGATADKPGVTVYGSDDGGTTRRAVSTDESGALKTQLTGNIVDGAIETLGTKAQTWKTDPASPMSIMEALKGIMTLMEDGTPGPSRLAQIQTLLADPATSAKQDAAKVVLDAISTAVAARATEATLAQIKTALTDGTLKAQLSGSLITDAAPVITRQAKRMSIETVIDAASIVASGNTGWQTIDGQGASLVLLAINVDKTPWTLQGWGMFGAQPTTNGTWPMWSAAGAYASVALPAVGLCIMHNASGFLTTALDGLKPTNFAEALALARSDDSMKYRVLNSSADTATVTLRVVRVWR